MNEIKLRRRSEDEILEALFARTSLAIADQMLIRLLVNEAKARPHIPESVVNGVFARLRSELSRRLAKHGLGAYVGPHEAYGVIAEEFNLELLEALRKNDRDLFIKELYDVAVGCLWAIASEENRKVERG